MADIRLEIVDHLGEPIPLGVKWESTRLHVDASRVRRMDARFSDDNAAIVLTVWTDADPEDVAIGAVLAIGDGLLDTEEYPYVREEEVVE